jgi:hypothetical protein
VHGEFTGGWRYRAYVMGPLDALGFSADEGIRGGRQKGSAASAPSAAVTGRLEYLGRPGLTIGASTWLGHGHVFSTPLETGVRLLEADARYQRDRLELRGQVAHVAIPNAGGINQSVAQQSGVDPNIAKSLVGAYAEAAYRIVALGSPRDLVTFIRYEYVDTQHGMPTGSLPLNQFTRDVVTTGVTYYPDPDIAVKADYTWLHRRTDLIRGGSSFNLGLGWWF